MFSPPASQGVGNFIPMSIFLNVRCAEVSLNFPEVDTIVIRVLRESFNCCAPVESFNPVVALKLIETGIGLIDRDRIVWVNPRSY